MIGIEWGMLLTLVEWTYLIAWSERDEIWLTFDLSHVSVWCMSDSIIFFTFAGNSLCPWNGSSFLLYRYFYYQVHISLFSEYSLPKSVYRNLVTLFLYANCVFVFMLLCSFFIFFNLEDLTYYRCSIVKFIELVTLIYANEVVLVTIFS